MREIIEKEIKWCEEHRGMKSEVYEEAFIAGLKQVLFFINETEKLEAVDNMSDDQKSAEHSVHPTAFGARLRARLANYLFDLSTYLSQSGGG